MFKVIEYDGLGVLTWASEDTKVWPHEFAAAAPAADAVSVPVAAAAEVKPTRPLYKKWWVWAIAGVLLVGVISNLSGGPEHE